MSGKNIDTRLIPAFPDLNLEWELWNQGVEFVAGIDEAGRGALAGPVAAAAVILPSKNKEIEVALEGVRDSKQMTISQREAWSLSIKQTVEDFGIGFANAKEIDRLGIVPATRLAIRRALLALDSFPDYLLIDHLSLPEISLPQSSLVKGDCRSLSIAAASVVAKTARDDRMRVFSIEYPGYAFKDNKGYGTEAHIKALEHLGPSPIHRYSFAPLKYQ